MGDKLRNLTVIAYPAIEIFEGCFCFWS